MSQIPDGVASVDHVRFGAHDGHRSIDACLLTNATGMQVRILALGGIVQSLTAPDRTGAFANVTLGYDTLEPYLDDQCFIGCLVGRYANRIAHGRFTLDGRTYRLPRNNGLHHLHGGDAGFHRATWALEPFLDHDGAGVMLGWTSPRGDQGYPGTLAVRVTCTLSDAGVLAFDYYATTDAPTHVNLSQHSYFNLAGHGDVLDHELAIAAARFTPVDSTLIPLGAYQAVEGTPFDFRSPHRIGERIDADDDQLRIGAGYDHNFVLDGPHDGGVAFAARLRDPASGRVLEIHTSEPGLQIYTGNHLETCGPADRRQGHRGGIALEPQHFPDSPNQPAFPSTVLRPGDVYRSRTEYRFSVD